MICSDDYAPSRCGGPAETLLSSSWRGVTILYSKIILNLHLSSLAAAEISLCQTPVDAICRWKKIIKSTGGFMSRSENEHLTLVEMKGKSWEVLLICRNTLQDSSYIQQLSIPMAGLTLKTRVFAAVKANNLDRRYSLSVHIFPPNCSLLIYRGQWNHIKLTAISRTLGQVGGPLRPEEHTEGRGTPYQTLT